MLLTPPSFNTKSSLLLKKLTWQRKPAVLRVRRRIHPKLWFENIRGAGVMGLKLQGRCLGATWVLAAGKLAVVSTSWDMTRDQNG